jgi:hypothetical protein
MKISGQSQAVLIKFAAVAAAILGAVYLLKKAGGIAGETIGAIADATVTAVNPANPENIVNRGVSAVGSAIVSDTGPGRNADGSWTLGGWLYDVSH